MAQLEDMISSILSDPQSMQMVSSLLSGLGENPKEPPQNEPAAALPDIADLEKLGGVLKKMNGPPDDRCRLLMALKPFVAVERRERIDQSVQLLKLMSIAQSFGGINLV